MSRQAMLAKKFSIPGRSVHRPAGSVLANPDPKDGRADCATPPRPSLPPDVHHHGRRRPTLHQMADKEPVVERHVAEEEGEDSAAAGGGGEEEDTGAQVAPIVRLEEVAVTTGEEDEDTLLDMKAKLYRFDKDGNQWKERGTGTVKLLKHKENGKVRLVMRQAKTLKICANHLVISTTKMAEHAGSDKSCVWHAADFADGELKDEMFAIRFGSVERMDPYVYNMIKPMLAVRTAAQTSAWTKKVKAELGSNAWSMSRRCS